MYYIHALINWQSPVTALKQEYERYVRRAVVLIQALVTCCFVTQTDVRLNQTKCESLAYSQINHRKGEWNTKHLDEPWLDTVLIQTILKFNREYSRTSSESVHLNKTLDGVRVCSQVEHTTTTTTAPYNSSSERLRSLHTYIEHIAN